MKKFLFLAMCLLFMAACKKNDPPLSSYSYSFIGNGFQFQGNEYTASYVVDTLGKKTFSAKFYERLPVDSDYVNFIFADSNYIDTGITYLNAGAFSFHDQGVVYSEVYGSYTISKLDTVNNLISGTFQFRGTNSVEAILEQNITNGVFTNIHYKAQ